MKAWARIGRRVASSGRIALPNESALRANLLSLAATRTRHVGNDPNVERYDPDLWTDEFYFLNRPGQAEIQSDLFYDYRTNVDAYPKWQAWMRENQPRLLVIWGKYELSFDPGEPERYRKDVPNAEVHIVDGGHFALDTAADQIAAFVRGFLGSSREGPKERRAGRVQRGNSGAQCCTLYGPGKHRRVRRFIGRGLRFHCGPLGVIPELDHHIEHDRNRLT